MTQNELRRSVVKGITAYNGAKKGSAYHREILRIFNDSGLCKRYKMTLSDPWCATTASAAYIKAGLTSIFPCVECSCSAMIRKAKEAGIWVEKDSFVPKIADLILYDWDDSGKGDCTGEPEHVGIVTRVSDGVIRVFEGNMNDACGYRDIPVNGRYIRGFITPKFSLIATKPKPVLERKGYKRGDSTRGVLALKQLLSIAGKKGVIPVSVNNTKTFGRGTEKAVNALLKKLGYKQTGVAGAKFIKKLTELISK
ncbi:MAG: CHAP domain-containing protein [Ruminococcus sp.]|nr:CHAP domain-containing protein [Ruminococcus sp.]